MVIYIVGFVSGIINIIDLNKIVLGNEINLCIVGIDNEFYFLIGEFVVEGLVLIVICILVIIGNICMWIIVIWNKDLRIVINFFLLILVVVDLMVFIINMLVIILIIFRG